MPHEPQTISTLLPHLWFLPPLVVGGCAAVGSHRGFLRLSLCSIIVAALLGGALPPNHELLACLDDGLVDEALDLVLWMGVTAVAVAAGLYRRRRSTRVSRDRAG